MAIKNRYFTIFHIRKYYYAINLTTYLFLPHQISPKMHRFPNNLCKCLCFVVDLRCFQLNKCFCTKNKYIYACAYVYVCSYGLRI